MGDLTSLVADIKKKWVCYFLLPSQTNNIEKPEWYLNQTLKWIHENIDSVEKDATPQVTDCSMKQKFILCMLELVMKRLKKDMTEISDLENYQHEVILVHTYNEVLQFTRVVRRLLGDSYHKLDEQHDLLSVFSSSNLFEKIVEVEWDYADKNLNDITRSSVRWDSVLDNEFVDIYKVPRCVDYLLMLIKSISERVECFNQPDCQFNLIELQCSLLSKFLSFLKRSTETSSINKNILSDMLFFTDQSTIDLTLIARILNGVNFLRLLLKEKSFIPSELLNDEFNPALMNKVNQLAQDYRTYFDQLIEKVVAISDELSCDLKDFLAFIKPKLSPHIFQIIRDEATNKLQERKTKSLLEGWNISRE